MGMLKINTIGIEQANKVMHLSAIAYNLKKYLKFEQKQVKSGAGILALAAFAKSVFQDLRNTSIAHKKLTYNL